MYFANLDMSVRRSLLEKGLPLHYYLQELLHQSACVRELSKDTLKLVNTVSLVVNSYGASSLPDDFVDEVAVSFPVGQELSKIPKKDTLSPLRLVDDTGAFIPYTQQSSSSITASTFMGVPVGWGWYWNFNDFGEPTGRFFGAHGGVSYGYQIFRERRQIQFTEDFIGSENVVLMYISNGQHADNATQLDWRAFRCIQTYSDWMGSPNASNKDAPEARTYYNEKRLLRANMNDLTIEDIKQTLRHSYTAAMKS
jgi:hypothetical protein